MITHKSDSPFSSLKIGARCGLPDDAFKKGSKHFHTKKWENVNCKNCLKTAPKR